MGLGRKGDWAVGESARRRDARVAGVAYLLTIAAGLFAEVYVRGSLRVAGDAAQTAANLLAQPGLFRLGIFADLVMLASYVVVTTLLYRIFRLAGPALSLTAAGFSLTGIALLAANTGLLAAPPILLGDSNILAALPAVQREALAYAVLRMHGHIYGFTGLFFGLYCLAIGWLVVRSGALPRLIGWLMMLAGATFLLDVGLDALAPALARQVPDVVMLFSLLGEGALALWLAIFGLSRPAMGAERME